MGLRLRAAGRGEENNRRGGREREGRREGGTQGPPPAWTGSALWGTQNPGLSEYRRSGEKPAGHDPRPTRPHFHGPEAPGRGRVTLATPLRAFFRAPVAPPATRRGVGGPAKHPLPAPINPICPVSGLGPALSPSLQSSPPSPGCRGKGESFRARKLPALSPDPPGPRPSAQLPADHSPDRGYPAPGTRSSSESVASSSSALVPSFSSSLYGVPGLFVPFLLLQARRPMLQSPAARGPPLSRSPRADPAPFGPAVQPPPPSPGPAARGAAPARGPRCAPRAPRRAPAAPWLCCSRSALGAPLGSSGAALAQMC